MQCMPKSYCQLPDFVEPMALSLNLTYFLKNVLFSNENQNEVHYS